MSMFEFLIVVFFAPIIFFFGFMFCFVLSPFIDPVIIWCERKRNEIEDMIKLRCGDKNEY